MRVFTCTPVNFGGGEDFFARDSGLLCRGFQSIGIESRAVMPGERLPGDMDDLIRTSDQNLRSVGWWRSHELDGVVLYAWGHPRFLPVARAIHKAGIRLILNQDSSGLVSPFSGLGEWFDEQRALSCSPWSFWLRVGRGLTWGLMVTDPLRAMHLWQGDVIAPVSPVATERYRRLCRNYGGTNLADRVTLVPHPVEPGFRFGGTAKDRHVACVGRWDDQVQKRPQMLTAVVSSLLAHDPAIGVSIAGKLTDGIRRWHAALRPDQQGRVDLIGRIERSALVALLNRSRIFYSPSAFESFGIAAAEALCCGCSVVGARSVAMPAFPWFVSEESGTLCDDNQAGHQSAILTELAAWDGGKRQADLISTTWGRRLHAPNVARLIMRMIERFD